MRRAGFCLRLAYRYASNPSEAEDIAQDALLRAWRRRSTLRDGDRRNQWLATIVRNEAFRQHARVRPDPTATIESYEGADDERVVATVERADLHAALGRLAGQGPPAAAAPLRRGPDPGRDREPPRDPGRDGQGQAAPRSRQAAPSLRPPLCRRSPLYTRASGQGRSPGCPVVAAPVAALAGLFGERKGSSRLHGRADTRVSMSGGATTSWCGWKWLLPSSIGGTRYFGSCTGICERLAKWPAMPSRCRTAVNLDRSTLRF